MNQNKQQLRILFVWYLLALTVVGGLLPLLPVHARNLGAEPGLVGYYLAFVYVAIMAGSLYAARLSGRPHSRRRWLIAASAGVPIGVALMAWAGTVWQLAIVTAMVWFCFGLASPLASTIVALRARETQRGRTFGTIGITRGLGALIGGATLGPAADLWTYRGMFLFAAALGALFLLASLFIRDVDVASHQERREDVRTGARLGWRFWTLLGAILMVAVDNYVATISRSLVMNAAGFAATAISITASIMGLAGLLAQPAMGWLSDRLGRRSLLAMSFAAMGLALWMLSASVALWHFWLVAILLGLASAREPLQKALVADTVRTGSLGVGMAFLSASGWVGGIIGFGVAGNALQTLGAGPTLLAAGSLSIVAIGALVAVRSGVGAPVIEARAEVARGSGG